MLAAVAVVSLTGCSIFMTHGPSDSAVAGKSAPDCTTSMTYPAIDGVIAAVITVAMISSISSKDNQTEENNGDAIASGFIVAGTAGASALIGHGRVSKCRRATETYTAQNYGQQTYPYAAQGYTYPQQQYPYGYPQQGYPQQYPQQGYPQQYPAQQYPAQQQYPTQQTPTQPPAQKPPPATQKPPQQPATTAPKSTIPPVPLNPPIPKQPPPATTQPPPPPTKPPATTPPAKTPPPPPPARPPAKQPDPVLGTEGDVCTAQTDCASGYTCTGNVCLKQK